MSEAQQRYLEKINATFNANLAFFKEQLPSLYESLIQASSAAKITTRINEQLEVELRFDEQPMPLNDLLDVTHQAMQIFESPARMAIIGRMKHTLPTEERDEPEEDDYLRSYMFSFHDSNCRNRIDNLFVRLCGQSKALDFPDFGERVAPIVIVFGSGYGSHLFQLLERFTIRHLIIIDNDPGITKLSLGFTDYVALYNDYLRRKNVHFTLISSSSPEDILSQLDQVLNHFWPPYFIHGISLFHNLRNTEVAAKIEEELQRKLWLYYRGWGWFDDEFLSVRHSLANFAARRPVLKRRRPIDPQAVAIVVANGPSLDNLVDLIRENRERAVVVSCGSALGSLSKYGIVPDFHVEIERPYATVEALQGTVSTELLSQVTLVGPNVLHPQVFESFGDGLMFMKMSDSAGDAAPLDFVRVATFPTVTNGATGWLMGMGFSRVLLIGTDMGARDPEKHHSAKSLYYNTDDLPKSFKDVAEKEAAKNVSGMTLAAPANFGGTAHSNDILTMARLRLEFEISLHPNAEVINLNDGVLIKGARPVRPEEYRFPTDVPTKQETLAQIRANFEAPGAFDEHKLHGVLVDQIRHFNAKIKPLLDQSPTSKLEVLDRLADILRTIDSLKTEAPAAMWTIRGSSLHLMRRIYDYLAVIPENGVATEFAKQAMAEVSAFLDTALATVEDTDPASPVPRVLAQDING
ncbi:MAG TPA: 6-hydroxymethylpterin diphosphokinase MptE-like protein [Rhodocyclaceae bacterium]